MKTLLLFLLVFNSLNTVLASENNISENKFFLESIPKQKILSRYQQNFSYKHDRGLFLSSTVGPKWNHNIKSPNAKAIRFGGKFSLGWFIKDGLALHGCTWGNFLEQASILALGSGVSLLFDGSNLGLDFSLGIGRVFNVVNDQNSFSFSETVLATHASLAKYWWLSDKTSLGLSLDSSLHGLTFSQLRFSSVGWSMGLSLAFLLG